MNEAALSVVLWIGGIGCAIIGALAGTILMLVRRDADKRDRNDEGRARTIARHRERAHDRDMETAIDLSAMEANVNVLMSDRGKCDRLAAEVAVLNDFKERAEGKFDEVDEAGRELRGLSEQMKTVFRRMDELPKAVTTEVMSQIPKAVLETLTAARSLQQAPQAQIGRAANG